MDYKKVDGVKMEMEHLVEKKKIKENINKFYQEYNANKSIDVEKYVDKEYYNIKHIKILEVIFGSIIPMLLVFVFIFGASKVVMFIIEEEMNIELDLSKYIVIILAVGIIVKLLFFNNYDYRKGKRVGKITLCNNKLIMNILNDDDFTDVNEVKTYALDEISILTKYQHKHETDRSLLYHDFIIYITSNGQKDIYYFDAIKRENEFYSLLIFIKLLKNNKDFLDISDEEIDNYLSEIYTGK